MSDSRLDRMIKLVAEQSIDKSSQVLSKTLKAGARIDLKDVSFLDVSEVTERMNRNNKEVVAAFIHLEGDAPFKFLFFVGIDDALRITDLFLEQPVGTTVEFDEYTTSAVQEVGNILSSAISNVFAKDFEVAMRPTPPVVMKDYSGALFEQCIVELAMEADQILIIESLFKVVQSELDCHMYLLPFAGAIDELEKVANKWFRKEEVKSGKKSILIIEDSKEDQEIYKAMLTNQGYEVDISSGANEAFDILNEKTYDLILCDYLMPEVDGEEFIKRLREDPKLNHYGVIMITSDENKETKVRLLKAGASDFIHKGAAFEEMVVRIETHIKAQHA